jgi:hypothetical protein
MLSCCCVLTYDRLADLLQLLSNDIRWQAFEQELRDRLLRVSDVPDQRVREGTTAERRTAVVNEDELAQWGQSKDHRPDLPQWQVILAGLDPVGMPLGTDVIAGEQADDPVFLPIIACMREGLDKSGVLEGTATGQRCRHEVWTSCTL